jgi:hypothetical protein
MTGPNLIASGRVPKTVKTIFFDELLEGRSANRFAGPDCSIVAVVDALQSIFSGVSSDKNLFRSDRTSLIHKGRVPEFKRQQTPELQRIVPDIHFVVFNHSRDGSWI